MGTIEFGFLTECLQVSTWKGHHGRSITANSLQGNSKHVLVCTLNGERHTKVGLVLQHGEEMGTQPGRRPLPKISKDEL